MFKRTIIACIPYRWRILIVGLFFSAIVIYTATSVQTPRPRPPSAVNSQLLNDLVQHDDARLGLKHFQSRLPTIQSRHLQVVETETEQKTREDRREAIRNSFLHAWRGYRTYAMGADELRPLSNEPANPFGGIGATLLDSLSTMLVMDLQQEFDDVLVWVESVRVRVNESLSVFETVIRCLGGLLSAYELASDHPQRHLLLEKAEEVGLTLLPAFDTPSGIPYYRFNPVTFESSDNITFLADAATIQLEFFLLSHHTGNPIFANKAQAITDFLDKTEIPSDRTLPGLFPTKLNVQTGDFRKTEISFGAMGDSAYEYFLKEYILTEGQVPQYERLYKNAIDSMKKNLLVQSIENTNHLYLPTYDLYVQDKMFTMDHLTCFVPGMLAIGSKIFERDEDLTIAKGLLESCLDMYRTTPAGLSPETWAFHDTVPYDPKRPKHAWWQRLVHPLPTTTDVRNRTLEEVTSKARNRVVYDSRYLLRPETVESLFVLYRVTGDVRYQEHGWRIYRALERHCRTSTGYASLRSVVRLRNKRPRLSNQLDSMESFLLAETFKYLYLLFSPPDLISLDKFVFNTEAHPFLRRPWAI
ncbi:MAG: glycoside hydrolase [Benjaminiella poitrasii]|nr:MAG: glycoside hydrolase [Benjaminiella poitrasii]